MRHCQTTTGFTVIGERKIARSFVCAFDRVARQVGNNRIMAAIENILNIYRYAIYYILFIIIASTLSRIMFDKCHGTANVVSRARL